MVTLNTIKSPVSLEMEEFQKYFRRNFQTEIPLLRLIVHYILRRKGKQMRPLLVFLCARLNGEIHEETYVAASLIEMLHTATLVHDDVVDEAHERRGFPSINALWKSKVAVLVGDYMLARGLKMSVEHEAYTMLHIISSAVSAMSEGELLQIQKSKKLNITEKEYYKIIEMKTASLIAACTSCGTFSTNRDPEVNEQMQLFGKYIGMAFQIRDDLFDYQRNGVTGKPAGNDLQEKKITLPLIHALDHSEKKIRKEMIGLIRNHHKNGKKIKTVVDFVRESNGIEYAIDQMFHYRDDALEILKKYPESETRSSLENFVHFTIKRKK